MKSVDGNVQNLLNQQLLTFKKIKESNEITRDLLSVKKFIKLIYVTPKDNHYVLRIELNTIKAKVLEKCNNMKGICNVVKEPKGLNTTILVDIQNNQLLNIVHFIITNLEELVTTVAPNLTDYIDIAMKEANIVFICNTYMNIGVKETFSFLDKYVKERKSKIRSDTKVFQNELRQKMNKFKVDQSIFKNGKNW